MPGMALLPVGRLVGTSVETAERARLGLAVGPTVSNGVWRVCSWPVPVLLRVCCGAVSEGPDATGLPRDFFLLV